tara:strand:- start:1488 stop:2300 length:813 start_codon:yes stop_codon:yes gene_type:complete
MTVNLSNKGLSEIANSFDLFYIDIWGVLHDGIKLNQDAVVVLSELDKLGKKYVLLTNAPRPNSDVIKFLEKLGLDEEKCSKVYTSGQGSLNYLKNEKKDLKFFHLGPDRDFNLFKNFQSLKRNQMKDADYMICTGLFDEHGNLDFYKKFLSQYKHKEMVCTNPDLIVDRGDVTEYCAGSIAKIFEDIGGKVKYFGKPYPLVYEKSINNKSKTVLCIGDNLNTDIKGANLQNFNSLFILNGIHKKENQNELNKLFEKYQVDVNYIQEKLKW